jgi:hypothetical protein
MKQILFFILMLALWQTVFEPQRIYLYDLNNNRPGIDYDYDGTSDC